MKLNIITGDEVKKDLDFLLAKELIYKDNKCKRKSVIALTKKYVDIEELQVEINDLFSNYGCKEGKIQEIKKILLGKLK